MSAEQKYKARFNTRLPNVDFLGVTVWPGKSEPNAEVITVQIRHQAGDTWETISRIAIYRTSDGRFLLLPERQPIATPSRAEAVEVVASGEGYE